jgi:hypothetical protein
LQLKTQGDWKFRKSGFFGKENNQEGAIPVILTLLIFLRLFDLHQFVYSTSLKVREPKCEIDFSLLHYLRRDHIELGIGECKSQGGRIDEKDIGNLRMIHEKLWRKGINCYLIFSKTADSFLPEEIALFESLQKDLIPFVLFTNRELEPYNPYWEEERADLPHRYPLSLQELADNSHHIYLRGTSGPVV